MKSPRYPVVIISYEMFLRTHESLRELKFDVIVCDEGHRLKNNATKTTSVCHTCVCGAGVVYLCVVPLPFCTTSEFTHGIVS